MTKKLGKFEYAPGQPVKITKLDPYEFARMMLSMERSIQRMQKIPNRLYGARMKLDEAV